MSWRVTKDIGRRKSGPRSRSGGGKEAVREKAQNKAAATVVTAANAAVKMSTFVKFYKDGGIIPEEDWKDFLGGIFVKPTLAFRIPRTHRICNNILEAKKGAVSQSDVLLEKFKTELLPDILQRKIKDVPCEMKCLEWYPNEYAWQANFNNDQLKASEELNELVNFIIEETSGFNVMRQDIHTMIPPILLDVQPHHKVLDMFTSPGWMAAQLSEDLYANPRSWPSGFLVTNDSDSTKMQWRWIQGTNMMYLHHDARYMPWLYYEREHTPENRILFDKILCDVPCSEDGQLGKQAVKRTAWNMKEAFNNHKNQKRFLQRGIELLAEDGDLLYTSSSMNPLENEAVVAAILRMAPNVIQLKDIRDELPGFKSRPGLNKWKVMTEYGKFYESVMEAPEFFKKDHDDSVFPPSSDEAELFCLDKCMRVYPHDNNTAGFFCALLTKTGPLPWVSQVSDSESLPVEPEEEYYELPKLNYVKPFQYVFDVKVTEIEWNIEKTNNKLETTTTSDVVSYNIPNPKLMQSCVKIPKEESSKLRNHFMKADDPGWLSIKEFYGFSNDFDPKCIFMRGGIDNYHLYYHHPIIKQLFMANKNVHADKKLRNSGLKIFRTINHEESPDCKFVLSDQGILMILGLMKKRTVKISSEDMSQLLLKKTIPLEDISDSLRASLPKQTGCTVFHYIPKGRNPDPKCEIILVGWVGRSIIKSCTDQSIDATHYMRLCGIDNPNKPRKPSQPVKLEDDVKMEEEDDSLLDD